MTLQEALAKFDAQFSWNESENTWCLSGAASGLGWETDDYEAETREQAESDAVDYLIAYNEPA